MESHLVIKTYLAVFMACCVLAMAWYQYGYMLISNKAIFTNIPDGYKIVQSLETKIYHISEKPNETIIWYSKDGMLELVKDY